MKGFGRKNVIQLSVCGYKCTLESDHRIMIRIIITFRTCDENCSRTYMCT